MGEGIELTCTDCGVKGKWVNVNGIMYRCNLCSVGPNDQLPFCEQCIYEIHYTREPLETRPLPHVRKAWWEKEEEEEK